MRDFVMWAPETVGTRRTGLTDKSMSLVDQSLLNNPLSKKTIMDVNSDEYAKIDSSIPEKIKEIKYLLNGGIILKKTNEEGKDENERARNGLFDNIVKHYDNLIEDCDAYKKSHWFKNKKIEALLQIAIRDQNTLKISRRVLNAGLTPLGSLKMKWKELLNSSPEDIIRPHVAEIAAKGDDPSHKEGWIMNLRNNKEIETYHRIIPGANFTDKIFSDYSTGQILETLRTLRKATDWTGKDDVKNLPQFSEEEKQQIIETEEKAATAVVAMLIKVVNEMGTAVFEYWLPSLPTHIMERFKEMKNFIQALIAYNDGENKTLERLIRFITAIDALRLHLIDQKDMLGAFGEYGVLKQLMPTVLKQFKEMKIVIPYRDFENVPGVVRLDVKFSHAQLAGLGLTGDFIKDELKRMGLTEEFIKDKLERRGVTEIIKEGRRAPLTMEELKTNGTLFKHN